MATHTELFNTAVRSSLSADTMKALKAIGFNTSSAGFANSIYGGRNILNIFTEAQISTKLTNGDFSNLFIGDYIVKPIVVNNTTYNVKWLFAHFNYYKNMGYPNNCTANHIVLIPEGNILYATVNDTNTTEGGWLGSKMWTDTLPPVSDAIKTAFGEAHVQEFCSLLTNSVGTSLASMCGAGRTGASNGWAWTSNVVCNLMSEPMVYGSSVWGSSAYDVGERKSQFAIFNLHPQAMNIRDGFWLSTVASSSTFCLADYNGGASDCGAADYRLGVRPYFLYH